MFLLIEPASRRCYRHELAAMHRLRHKIFIEELGWPVGDIRADNGMEHDQFDDERAHYIVHLNTRDEVDACVRLLPTDGPYLLGDVFPHLVESGVPPRSAKVWEISRFCADRSTAPSNVVGLFCTAIVEFAVDRGLDGIVSVSDIRMEPLMRRAGWSPHRLGQTTPTATDVAVGFTYPADQAALDRLRLKSRIPGRLLPHREPEVIVQPQRTLTHAFNR